jgi:exopolyphosphatase/guanosine-5'-triphosphate,3'-diphosphate pyrophosphatase
VRVAVIDLGSNSFRLFVADVATNGELIEVLVEKRMLRLGAHIGRDGRIPPKARKAALAATRELHESAVGWEPDAVVAVATSAIRDAENSDAVVAELSAVIGAPVRVHDGEEEATLSFIGVTAGFPAHRKDRAILDLGGGSLELAWGRHARPSAVATAAVGVARLAAEAGVQSVPTRKQLGRVRDIARQRIGEAAGERSDATAPVILGGGSARAVARAIRSSRASVHGVAIDAGDVDQLAERLTATSLEERLAMSGVSQRRALDLPVAAAVVASALEVLGASSVTMSEWGLRHGVALDAASDRDATPTR